MRSKSAEKVKLSSFDDLFGKEEPVSGEVVTSVPMICCTHLKITHFMCWTMKKWQKP